MEEIWHVIICKTSFAFSKLKSAARSQNEMREDFV